MNKTIDLFKGDSFNCLLEFSIPNVLQCVPRGSLTDTMMVM